MFDQLKNLNIATCSDEELKTLIKHTLPIVLTFVKACQKLFGEESKSNNNPCQNCTEAATCKEPCGSLEDILPGNLSGGHILNKTYGNLLEDISDTNIGNTDDDGGKPQRLDRSSLRSMDRVRSDEIFMLYKNCHPIFTTKEWRVVTLKIGEGHTYNTIGQKLNIAPSTASDTFQRAKTKMEYYYNRQRTR